MKIDFDSEALVALIANVEHRNALGSSAQTRDFVHHEGDGGMNIYGNRDEQAGIDFKVERLGFPDIQVMDPRIVRIAPGKCNELHRHAHESLFVVLKGHGEVMVGKKICPIKKGDIAFVPRWALHQTRNLDPHQPLELLAITDFGFSSAILGNYDQTTRLKTDTI
jgi:mannose-6-phosphate isomerase-like protein (cupin superfamily)